MKVLISGHLGFIGRHLAAALADNRYQVIGIDAPQDMRRVLLDNLTRYDLAIHCAALVNGRESIEGQPAYLAAYNLQLDGLFFEWALRAKPGRIVYISSSAAYPTIMQTDATWLMREDWALPAELADQTYGMTKVIGERLACGVREAGVPVTVVRPFSGYGSDQDPRYPFPAMIARAKAREDPFTVWGDGQQVRDFIHVEDICGAILALVREGIDGPVNLGTGVPTSMDQLARLCMELAGYDAPIRHLSDKPAGVRYRVADPTLLRQHYAPKISLAEGVERAVR